MNWLRRIAAKYLFDGQALGILYQVPRKGKPITKGWIYGKGDWVINFSVGFSDKVEKISE